MIHVSTQYWNIIDINNSEWIVLTVYNCASRWAVPIFVMVTGVLLGNPKKSLDTEKLKQKILHIICCFLFWSIVYTALSNMPKILTGRKQSLISIISEILTGHFHLWYCYMLIGLYLIIPFLKEIIANEKLLKYFLSLSFIFTFFISPMTEYFELGFVNNVFSKMEWHFTLGYSAYFVMGYFIMKCDISKRMQKIIRIVGLISMGITILVTIWGSYVKGEAWGVIHYFQPNIMLISVTLFIFFKYKEKSVCSLKKNYSKNIEWLSSNTLGVYLIHVLWREILAKVGICSITFHPLIMVPLLTVVIAFLSYVSVWMIKKVPYINRYIV